MKKILLLIFVLSNTLFTGKAQTSIIDSLQNVIKTDKADTNKVNHLLKLSNQLRAEGNCNDAVKYGKLALTLSETLNYKKGIANSYFSMAEAYYWKSDFANAIENHLKSLKSNEAMGYKLQISIVLNDLGNDYFWKGDYPTALSYFLKSLTIAQQLKNKVSLMSIYISIGQANEAQKRDSVAFGYYCKALEVSKKLADKHGIEASSANMASIYFKFKKYEKAIEFFELAMKISYEINMKYGIQSNAMRLGEIYQTKKEYDKALDCFMKSLPLARDMDDKDGIAALLDNIGKVYTIQNKFADAEKYLLQSKAMADSIGALLRQRDVANSLSNLYEKTNKPNKALEYFKLYNILNDSIYNAENSRQMGDLKTNFAVEKKETELKAEHEKKDIIATHEINHQKNVRNYTLAGLAGVLLFLIIVFRQHNKIKKGKKRSDELLLNILPEEVAEELKETGSAKAKSFDNVTVLFTDFKGFTTISEKMSPKELVSELHHCFSAFDKITQKYGLEKIKTIGDAYMCVAGLPHVSEENAIDAVKAGIAIRNFMHTYNEDKTAHGKEIFEIRIGIHTGPVVAGIVGIKKFAYDIWGDTVNTASRMESSSETGKVNISGTTYDLVKDYFTCIHRGKVKAKNKGEIDMYFAEHL